MKIGTGNHTYEWIDGWGKLPKGIQYGYTHGVVVDQKDNVYIHNQSKDAVIVFDKEGNFIRSWGESFKDGAHGMFYNKEGGREFLYFSDYVRHLVCKTTIDGEMIWCQGAHKRPDKYASEEEYKTTDLAVAPNGDIYVGDGYGQSWIHQYDKDAKYLQSFGGPAGSDPGKVSGPHGVWVDTRRGEPELYVADRSNNRVQVFTLDGKHKRFLTNDMKAPCCFYQFKDMMLIPHLQARVTIWDKDDKTVAILGDNPEAPTTQGWPNIQDKLQPGKFNSPHAACFDSKGDIYVVEWISTGRVTKLKKTN